MRLGTGQPTFQQTQHSVREMLAQELHTPGSFPCSQSLLPAAQILHTILFSLVLLLGLALSPDMEPSESQQCQAPHAKEQQRADC